MQDESREDFIKEIKSAVSESIGFMREVSDEEVKDLITKAVFEKSRHSYISISEKRDIIENVFNSMRRLGILQPLVEDKAVTEIMINGPDKVFIEKEGRVFLTDLRFESREKLEDLIQSVVSKANRAVNEASPIVDARLSDGSRVNVVLQPIAINGPVMTIRKFPQKPMTIDDLVKCGSLSEEAAEALRLMVRAKYNIFICGGTGSGKTTFLNALSGLIPPYERIITIEDSAELQIIGIENIVKMETRDANTEGKGKITMRDLIRTSLRMRPERIIVGEVRGPEALDMLQAMNTGHDGSLSTGHANSAADMLSRLETMVLSAAPLPLEAIRQQIASAVDIIVHLSRLRDRSRRTMEISEIAGYKGGQIHLNPIFKFVEDSRSDDDKVQGSLRRTDNEMIHTAKFRTAGISAKV